ncbi:NUDIX hydrolase [candidate division KSB1 bacterium]|nr:NUDIX hydrolase [candidate division KSB1 bacterium]
MDYIYCPVCRSKLQDRVLEGVVRKACGKCDFVHYRNPAPAAGIVCMMDNKVLLVKRKYPPKAGEWSLPAGFIEYHENPRDTAVRETFEETGFKVEIIDLLNVYGSCDDPRTRVVLIVFTARIIGGELTPGDDASDAGFFDVEAIDVKLAFENHREALHDYRKRIKYD